jgi:hypothetical protein
MNVDDALDVAVYVLHHSSEKKLRAGQITALAMASELRSLWSQRGIEVPREDANGSRDSFSAELARRLGQHVSLTSPRQRVVEGNSNGWRLGARAGTHLIDVAPTLRVTSDRQLLGLAGEYAVMSELLMLDWNVAKPPFDNGVDLFATKDGEVRTVQVKTAASKSLGNSSFNFTGGTRSHLQYNNVHHYYVLVFRTIAGSRWENAFYACSSTLFDQHLHTYAAFDRERPSWSLRVDRVDDKLFVGGELDISSDMNRLDSRFH